MQCNCKKNRNYNILSEKKLLENNLFEKNSTENGLSKNKDLYNKLYKLDDFKKVYISTYGCQMNIVDSERMYSLLENENYSRVKSPNEASVIIINTCSVREKPVHKVVSELGRYKLLKKQNNKLKVGVSGCVAQQLQEKLFKDNIVDFIIGTDSIDNLPDILNKLYEGEKKIIDTDFKKEDLYHFQTLVKNPQISTYLNITKGCNNFCTFCIVPFTRGREKSRPMQDIVKDINNLSQKGVKEVFLLGQNVNSYKSNCGARFPQLLEELVLNTDLFRIRFITFHPKDFNDEIINLFVKYNKKLGKHIHLPVQSGSSKILKLMNRKYSREDYLNNILKLQNNIPDMVYSTDIIVGFPGEEQEDYLQTLDLMEKIKYDFVYAFKFNPRPYTKAQSFSNQVSEEIKNQRLNILLEKQIKISHELIKYYLGKNVEVLLESYNKKEGFYLGRSEQNKLVKFHSSESDLLGDLVNLKVTDINSTTLIAEML